MGDGIGHLIGMNGVDVKGREVFRLFRAHDRVTGAKRQPFMHSSVPAPSADHLDEHPAAGRFDRRSPRGTCYLASGRLGAWVEVFRGARMVDRRDARARRMVQSRVPRRLVLTDATITHPLDDLALLTGLAACGLGVAGVPHDLPVVQPVAQPQR